MKVMITVIMIKMMMVLMVMMMMEVNIERRKGEEVAAVQATMQSTISVCLVAA